MIIAVIPVRVMGMSINQVVDVVSMGDRRMTAVRAVHVIRIMALAIVLDAPVRVRFRYFYDVLVVVVFVRAVQVTIMKIAHVVPVLDCDVATVRAVHVGMVFMDFAAHGCFSRIKSQC